MGSICDKYTEGIWNPTIHQGQTFNPTILIAVDGVVGYDPNDTFFGWISSELEADPVLVDYAFTQTDPVTGLLSLLLTPAQTLALPIGTIFHSAEWHRDVKADVVPIFGGRPLIKGRAKG